ncbi:glycosyltransferase family 2 protein [Sporolactobacillus sp. CPB3-1]|uniref:Glycosyltransferase family 2 protein n=1 Tax=Sporolactobacillus mangiferae TaxID=2940498 RepID=A0ABT0MD09_9BACL|nr:glycosyltransferase family 2 protein [Sporolactobacillus mangiferae]MCL1632760.1 glycosyltransferase family 2 protein [Sporolactobacillus mangiferae]
MDISVIIPTFNEGNNVRIIAKRIEEALQPTGKSFEILFVDDSTDNTPELLEQLSNKDPFVDYLHRTNRRGLATAVTDGLKCALGDNLVVMDADLQHPPELIPAMIDKLSEGFQMVVPSRFVPGGSDGGLNFYRKFVSWTARTIARLALKRLRKITDPTSGFFAVKRSAIQGNVYHPIGWKIMIELIVRAHITSIAEIPYQFHARDLGSSKMSGSEQLRYLIHLARLVMISEEDRKFFSFCAIGLSGVIVNLAIYKVMLLLRSPVVLAFMLSSIISMASNYVLNSTLTWKSRSVRQANRQMIQFLRYAAVAAGGLCISSGFLSFLYYMIHFRPMFSGLLGIVTGVIWNYVMNDRWTFSPKKASVPANTVETVAQHVQK